MTNRRESGEGSGLFEDQEPCLRQSIEPDGSIVFASDNAHPDAPSRAFRLVALLKWFPLDAAATQRIASPARTEKLSLADLARYLWSASRDPGERRIEEQSDAELKAFLASFHMLPGWFRKPAFLRNDNFVSYVKADADFTRKIPLDGFDEDAIVRRLKRAGLSEKMIGRDVHIDEFRQDVFPVRVPPEGGVSHSEQDFLYLRDSLAAMDDPISLADVEQLLLDRKNTEQGWLRQYIT